MRLQICLLLAVAASPVWAEPAPKNAAKPAASVQISSAALVGKWSGAGDALETLSFGPGNTFQYSLLTRSTEFYCEGRYTIRNGIAQLVGRSRRGEGELACTGTAALARDGESIRIQFREMVVQFVPIYNGRKKTWRTIRRFVPHPARVLRREPDGRGI